MTRRDIIQAIGGVAPLSAVALTIEAHRNALAADDRNFARNDVTAAEALHLAERAAWEAFIATPCGTPADVQAKVSYLVGSERLMKWVFDGNDEPAQILQSLLIQQGEPR